MERRRNLLKKSFDICVDGGGCFVKWNVYEFKKGKSRDILSISCAFFKALQ